MAAILAAILDFGYLQKSKHLNNASGRFVIPQNICLDTLLVFLVCMVRKLWSKYKNGGHFGRHLGFWRMPTWDFRGLFISDSTHIPGPILKKSACYQKCPPFGLYELILLGYKGKIIIWAYSFVKKRRRFLALFVSIFLRNRSLSDARWFYGKKRKIGKGNLYLAENRLSWNEMCCASDNHKYMCHTCAKEFLNSSFN